MDCHAMVQERPIRVERRLAAILAADVVGYSRLMHHEEEATHARLTYLLTEAVHPAIAEYGGRIVKNTGDVFLQSFRALCKRYGLLWNSKPASENSQLRTRRMIAF